MVSGIKVEITKEKLFEEYIIKKKSMTQIAREIGCCKEVISNKIKEFGIPKKEKEESYFQKRLSRKFLIEEYINNDRSSEEIAKEIGCSSALVNIQIKKFHIKKWPKLIDWEKDFIRLAYPLFENKAIAKILKCSKSTIVRFVKNNNLSKIKSVYPGDKFGRLIVLNEKKYDANNFLYWNCQCKCGVTKFISQSSLLECKTRSCGCFRKEKNSTRSKNIPGWFFYNSQRGARTRNIPFEITIEDLDEILVKQDFKCALTRVPLLIEFGNMKESMKKCNASVDRRDNSKGYTKDNAQIVHININDMKGTISQNFFINLCKLISENNKCDIDNNLINNFKKEPRLENSYKNQNKNIIQ